MRKFLIPILLASVAASPALAAPRDRSHDDDTRTERQQSKEDRHQVRESREDTRVERQQAREDRQQLREERVVQRDVEAARVARRDAAESAQQRATERQQVVTNRQEARRDARELRQSQRPVPAVRRNRVPVVSDTPREGTQPPVRSEPRHSSPVHWNTDWRHNSHYDWYNYRKRNRWLFNLGVYSDPFGWSYRPYSVGWRLWPSYYGSSFWLNDPWQYRLPYAPPGTRWIRYYDDAILVDTWNGQVIDVIYNFFW